jgi:hypothetical protein
MTEKRWRFTFGDTACPMTATSKECFWQEWSMEVSSVTEITACPALSRRSFRVSTRL